MFGQCTFEIDFMIAKTYINISLLFLIFTCIGHIHAQKADSFPEQLLLKVEVRPRAEYTYNYILPPNDSVVPYFYISQRNRISLQYSRKKWLLKSELQEIHLWDNANRASKIGSINFYQLFLERKFRPFSFRLGRQGVLLDNGRIFSDAPWAQQSRAHEGVRLMKYTAHISNDFFFLFTRKYGNLFESAYSPVGSHRYKYLIVNYFSYSPNQAFSFNNINAVDFFKNANSGKTYARITTGGRVELKNKKWYSTLNAFLQFGRTPQGKKLFAYYLQPEIRLSLPKSTWRLGAEILSGSRQGLPAGSSGDFDVLYGVAWKFMGNMNVFTTFPKDVAGKGLVNPYLFVLVPVNKKLSLRSDFHVFPPNIIWQILPGSL
ncbi:MAG: hypothetical protein EAZ89_11765 [Bacteroidetes bacterium]|nr:MAG: hypothetical protein EAZ89_11765 [Bacteroidota bacterium]